MTPEGWRQRRLDQVADIVGGGTPARDNAAYWNGDIPWATPTDITKLGARYIMTTRAAISRAGLEASSAALLPAGSVLMTSRATIGACAINRVPMTTNQGFQSLVPTPEAIAEFLAYLVAYRISDLIKLAAGSTFLEISRRSVAAFPVALPPLVEQRKIAAILASVDDAIEATQAIIHQLQVMKMATMAALLARGLPGRHTRFKQTDIGEIPQEWEVLPVGNVCSAVIDCKNRTPPYTPTGFPVIRTPNVRAGRLVLDDLRFTDAESHREWTARGTPKAGDLVITREAPVGEVCLIPRGMEVCLGQRMMLMRPSPARLLPKFLLVALQGDGVQKRLALISGGSTVGHVRVGDIRNLPVPIPSLDEQRAIACMFAYLADRTDAEYGVLEQMRIAKASLMSVLLTGELRVTLDEEAA